MLCNSKVSVYYQQEAQFKVAQDSIFEFHNDCSVFILEQSAHDCHLHHRAAS